MFKKEVCGRLAKVENLFDICNHKLQVKPKQLSDFFPKNYVQEERKGWKVGAVTLRVFPHESESRKGKKGSGKVLHHTIVSMVVD